MFHIHTIVNNWLGLLVEHWLDWTLLCTRGLGLVKFDFGKLKLISWIAKWKKQ